MEKALLIQVRKILKNQILLETIAISDIKSFRPWRKKENDTFDGEATFLVLRKKDKDGPENPDEEKKLPTMLIQEDYKNFSRRMEGKIISL